MTHVMIGNRNMYTDFTVLSVSYWLVLRYVVTLTLVSSSFVICSAHNGLLYFSYYTLVYYADIPKAYLTVLCMYTKLSHLMLKSCNWSPDFIGLCYDKSISIKSVQLSYGRSIQHWQKMTSGVGMG